MKLDRSALESLLRETDEARLERLWAEADEVRRRNVGDEVHLRGLIEVSSHCTRACHYCGLRAQNSDLVRYRMTEAEILGCATQAVRFGYGTVVMQSGEDPGLSADFIAAVVRRIKSETGLAVTLSLGERALEELELWRAAGADRYLLRFETSNPELYARIHPSHPRALSRIELLRGLRSLGFEIGSGVMVGIPGQTVEDLASDLELFHELDLDMIGVGPYMPHPATPLGQVPCDGPEGLDKELLTYKMVALARLMCPEANLPSTTALATLNPESGRELGLSRGANIVMPNLTPPEYRVLYEIYPNKACAHETAKVCNGCLRGRIERIGRRVGSGHGGRRRAARRAG
jgi:biotin synthase